MFERIRLILFPNKGITILVIGLVLGIIILGGLVLILNRRAPSPETDSKPVVFPAVLPTPGFKSATSISKTLGILTYPLTSLSIPERIEAYGVRSRNLDQERTNQIALDFGMTNTPQVIEDSGGVIYLWQRSGEPKKLVISPSRGYIEYSDQSFFGKSADSQPQTQVQTKEEAINLAKSFLESKKLYFQDLTSNVSDVVMLSEGDEPSVVQNMEEAGVFVVHIKKMLGLYPLYGQAGDTNQISVWIDKYKLIKKLEYNFVDLSVSQDKYPLLNFEELKAALERGLGTIVLYNGEPYDLAENPLNFQKTDVTAIDIGYLDNKDPVLATDDLKNDNFVLPIFVVKAAGFYPENNTPVPLVIYLPAVKR